MYIYVYTFAILSAIPISQRFLYAVQYTMFKDLVVSVWEFSRAVYNNRMAKSTNLCQQLVSLFHKAVT